MQTARVQNPSDTLRCVIRLRAPLFSRRAMLAVPMQRGEKETQA
jgi:hypothetical protein